jgi:hypothetical protein
MDYKNVDFRISTVKNDNGSTEIYLEHIGAWDDFDLILGLLQKENNCEILSNQEMIYIRKAELLLNGIGFQLMQDDMFGNYLFTEDDATVPLLQKLAQNVIDSIREKLKAKGLL